MSLQRNIRKNLRDASTTVPAELMNGLIKAHTKLADYFAKTDASPYYLWAGCKPLVDAYPFFSDYILQS
jgi:hypothetical protein